MKQQLQNWAENHRDQIGAVLNAVAVVAQIVATMTVRTFWGAAALLAYVFYNASPEDTLYGLAQFTHQDRFWMMAFSIAVVYSVVFGVVHGPQHRTAASGCAASATIKRPE